MSRCAALLDALDYLSVPALEQHLSVLKTIFGEVAEYHSICTLHHDLGLVLDTYHCILLERSLTSEELAQLPQYRLYRLRAFNVPFSAPVDKGTDFEELSSSSGSSVRGRATTT